MKLRPAIVPAALAVGVAVTRAMARPRSFWELDDYIFGLSLHVFAPQASVPQPPFFPGFVFVGRLVRFVVRDDVGALTVLSMVASCASVLLVFLIVETLLGEGRTALAAALLFAFYPASWFYAGIPASDSAGVAAALLTIWLFLLGMESPRILPLAGLAFGLAFAVRAQTAATALVPLALAIRKAPARRALETVLLLAASVLLLWALPVFLAAHGWRPILKVFARHAGYVAGSTSVVSSRPALRLLAYRWLVAPWVTLAYASSVATLAAAGVLLSTPALRRKLLVVSLAVVPYFAVAVVLLDCTFSGRYILPVLPFAALLVAAGARALDDRLSGALPTVTLGLAIWSGILLVPALRTLRHERAPADVAAERIRRLAAGRPIALTYPEELRVQAELLLPGAARLPAETTSRQTLEAASDRLWRFGVASINDPTAACWPSWKPFSTIGRGRYLLVPYGPWDRESPEFEEGWFGEETETSPGCALSVFRWMGSEARVRFPRSPGRRSLEMRLYVPLRELRRPPEIAIDWNGARLTEFVADSEWIERTVPLPLGSVSRLPSNSLTIRTSETFVPAERGAADTRRLGLQVRRMRLTSSG